MLRVAAFIQTCNNQLFIHAPLFLLLLHENIHTQITYYKSITCTIIEQISPV